MKAIIFPTRGEVTCASLPDPVAGNGEVVIAVKASGLCHTDFEVLKANYGTSAFPIVPGHEYAGVVADVGPGVTGFTVGDRVVVDPNLECGTCRACLRGWAHLCDSLGAYGVTESGGFALCEPMGCVLNGLDAVRSSTTDNALIFGAGPMGLLLAMALSAHNVPDIVFTDIDDARLELAASFGFEIVASGSSELATLNHGFDLVVDATGVPAVAGNLANYMANGARGLFFGVCPSDARIEFSPFEVFRRQLTFAGSHSLNHNIPQALETIAAFGPDISRVVSHRMTLEDVSNIMLSSPPKGSLKIQTTIS